MIAAFFSSAALVIYLIIRRLLSGSGVRSLVDNYGLDGHKLKSLKPAELKALNQQISQLRKQNNAFGLEDLLRKFRP